MNLFNPLYISGQCLLIDTMTYIKSPSMVIYWADTYALLTYLERKQLELSHTEVVAVSPMEVLLRTKEGRGVVIRGITDPHVPLSV